MGISIFKYNFHSRRSPALTIDRTNPVSHNFISGVIPNASCVHVEATVPLINYVLNYDYRVIFNYGQDKLLVSTNCILLLHTCNDNELSFSDIKAVLLLEIARSNSLYGEEYHKIYINRKYQDNSVVKAILKKAKGCIEGNNISVIYRELFVKDIVILPSEDLTFNYIDTILAKLRYVPPVVISEEVIRKQPIHLADDSDNEFGSEFDEDNYEDSLENVEVETESTQLVPIINVEQTTAVTTIMSLDEYINIVIDSEEPIRRIQSHVSLLESR